VATCSRCIWCGQCSTDGWCECLAPSEDDEYLDAVIEKNRCDFRREWFLYIEHVYE